MHMELQYTSPTLYFVKYYDNKPRTLFGLEYSIYFSYYKGLLSSAMPKRTHNTTLAHDTLRSDSIDWVTNMLCHVLCDNSSLYGIKQLPVLVAFISIIDYTIIMNVL